MSDPMPTVRDILYPDFSGNVTPIRPPAPSTPTLVQFTAPDPLEGNPYDLIEGEDYEVDL